MVWARCFASTLFICYIFFCLFEFIQHFAEYSSCFGNWYICAWMKPTWFYSTFSIWNPICMLSLSPSNLSCCANETFINTRNLNYFKWQLDFSTKVEKISFHLTFDIFSQSIAWIKIHSKSKTYPHTANKVQFSIQKHQHQHTCVRVSFVIVDLRLLGAQCECERNIITTINYKLRAKHNTMRPADANRLLESKTTTK